MFLFAQEHECIIRLTLGLNDEVQQDVLIKKQPGWGFTAMDILDFDNDGKLEILTSNGDTTEFRSHPRNYHGIRSMILPKIRLTRAVCSSAWSHGLYIL